MAKPVVLVLGASGNVGGAALRTLAARNADRLEIRAGARDPSKVEDAVGVSAVVQVGMGERERLRSVLEGVDGLLIVAPNAEDRAALVAATAASAKESGVKHIVMTSVLMAELRDTIFGGQFSEIESTVSQLGIPYTILRLPFFIDNYWAFQGSIQQLSTIYSPCSGNKPFTAVLIEDVGKACAAVLADPARHANKVYKLVSQPHTHEDIAVTFSKALSKPISYTQVSYEDTRRSYLALGIPEWQADGVLELYRQIDSGCAALNDDNLTDFFLITGDKPATLQDWVDSVKDAFL